MLRSAVAVLLESYPKIFQACHRVHVRDPRTKKLLSSHQASILDHLDPVSPTYLHQLAGHMAVTASTMSLNVDRLESAGYVRRGRDRDDARRVNLRLTAAGARIKSQRKILEPALVAELLGRLSAAERAAALGGLQILGRAAAELLAERQARRVAMGRAS
jgi:MarR family transcriptional regulator, organic hydroperoxide resistance regulator